MNQKLNQNQKQKTKHLSRTSENQAIDACTSDSGYSDFVLIRLGTIEKQGKEFMDSLCSRLDRSHMQFLNKESTDAFEIMEEIRRKYSL